MDAPNPDFAVARSADATAERVMQMSVGDLLASIPEKAQSPVIVFQSTDTVETVLKVLSERSIISAPVWCEEQQGYTQVDVLDLASAVFAAHGRNYEEVKSSFFNRRILEVCNLSTADPLRPVTMDTKVGDVLNYLTKGCHRVIVVDDSLEGVSKIRNIVSQYDMAKFLYLHIGAFYTFMKGVSVREVMHQPFLVPSDMPAVETLQKCVSMKYTGVGVVEPSSSKLITTLSNSDLRSVRTDNFWMLWLPVVDFLAAIGHTVKTVFTVPDATLGTVLQKIVDEHVHRVFVVDQANHPVGILTVTDVLAHMLARFAGALSG